MNKNTLIKVALIIILLIGFFIIKNTFFSENTINIGYLPIAGSHLLYIAQDQEYFSKSDLNVKFIQMQSSNHLSDALIRGDIDVAVEMSAMPIIKINEKSPGLLKIFLISKIYVEDEFDAIIVRNDSDIYSISDLENKKIAVFPGVTALKLLEHFLINKNIDVVESNLISIAPTNHLNSLIDGYVDAIHTYEPTVSYILENNLGKKIYGSVYSEQINPSPQGVAVMSKKFIEKNPEKANEVINVFLKSRNYLYEQEENARFVLAKNLGMDVNIIHNVKFYNRTLDDESVKSLIEYVNLLNELNLTNYNSQRISEILFDVDDLK